MFQVNFVFTLSPPTHMVHFWRM